MKKRVQDLYKIKPFIRRGGVADKIFQYNISDYLHEKYNIDKSKKIVFCLTRFVKYSRQEFSNLNNRFMGRKASFLIKEWFFLPMNLLFKLLGGNLVDRSRKSSLTEQMAEIYSKRDKFQLAITPEATRKANSEWKKGLPCQV